MKLDVICVCRRPPPESWFSNLKHLPVNKVIIECAKPLSLARSKSFGLVSTEFFVSLDDDVKISPEWFSTLFSHMKEDVAVVSGKHRIKGLSPQIDEEVNSLRNKITEIVLNERGITVNFIGRTSILREYFPSVNGLNAFEDFDISQFVLSRGFRWLEVPVKAFHYYNGIGCIIGKCIWNARGTKKLLKETNMNLLRKIVLKLFGGMVLGLLYVLFSRKQKRYHAFNSFCNFCTILGMFT